MNTIDQYNSVIDRCRSLFIKKMKDYGSAWRILRLPSLTDQLYIKAHRIRGLQENKEHKIDEDETTEFIGIINYALMALIQIEKGIAAQPDLNLEEATTLYDRKVTEARSLMEAKNHDYGEAWRDMRVSSYTDFILTKIERVKEMEDLNGQTLVSEGIDSNYMDIIIYAVFGAIKLHNE